MNVITDSEIDSEISDMLRSLELLEFSAAYSSLIILLARLRHSIHRQVAFAMSSGQTVKPEDSNHFDGSISTSSSTESKSKSYAQNVAIKLLTATHLMIDR